jgi:YidC/Oxa1 family membrane protein insertase
LSIFLAQSNVFIIGPIAKAFGFIMNGLFIFLENFGIQNIGVCIILFTIIVNIIMLPLTVKQQKFSKLSARMNPEIQAVQKKYKGKRDTVSMQKMNDETQAIYDKYGTSATGSCLPLFIQLPVIWGLYNVVLNVPSYVESVRTVFDPLVNSVMNISGYQDILTEFKTTAGLARVALNWEDPATTLVDIFYNCGTNGWNLLRQTFGDLTGQINTVQESMDRMNNFLGMNIANSPVDIIKDALADGRVILIVMALLIPILAILTNYINTKLMPQAANDNSTMGSSLKTMNIVMPIFSGVLCLTFATGIGLYWIANAVVRGIIQFITNKHLDKVDFDAEIAKNLEKAEKKREKKQGYTAQQMIENSRINTKNIKMESTADLSDNASYNVEAKPGSLREKANLVKKYNEKNNK